MADAPEAPEETRSQPGESIAKRLFSRGATRASVGSRAEFYHRLGVDDPYAVEDSSEGAQGAFTYLSSSAYYRDLRRSRLGLISRISGGGSRLGRVGQRAQRIGPAAMATRPSMLARHMGTEAAFELLDDPVLLARAEEEEEEGFRWPRTKPRPSRKVGPKARPMEAAVRREVVEVSSGTDEFERLIARALQTVRGSQREKLLDLLGDVQEAPERNRRAVVLRAVRGLRGPSAAATRADVLASEASTSRRAGAVAESRGDLRRSKGLRPALRRSAAVFSWLEPEQELEEEVQSSPHRARRPRSEAHRRPKPTRSIVARILDAESAALDGGTFSSEPTVAMRRVARRAGAGDVLPENGAAPVSRAATGYMRETRHPRRVRALRPRTSEMALAEPFRAHGEEDEVAAIAPRRRVVPATVRAIARAEKSTVAPAAPVRPTRRAPLSDTPVRAATTARRRRPALGGTTSVPRPVRRLPSMAAASLLSAPPELSEEALEALPPRRRRRPVAAAVAAAALQAAPAPLSVSTPVSATPRRRSMATEPTSVRAARRGVVGVEAQAAAAPHRRRRLTAIPTSYLEVSSEDIVSAVIGADAGGARRLRRAVAPAVAPVSTPAQADADTPPAVRAVRRRVGTIASAVAEPALLSDRDRLGDESSTVRAARRGVVDTTGTALLSGEKPRRRRLAPVPTSYLEATSDDVVASVTGDAPTARRRVVAAEAPVAERVAARAAVDPVSGSSAERPTVRVARRASEVSQRRRLASVIAAPTSYLEADLDEVIDDAAPLAPVRRRRAIEVAVEAGTIDAAEVSGQPDAPAARILRRAEEASDAEAPSLLDAAVRRTEAPASTPTRSGRLAVQPMELVDATSDEPQVEIAPTPRRKARLTVRALARSESAPRRDRRGRVLLGRTTPKLPSRRAAAPAEPTRAAPSARMLARGEEVTPERRSMLRRAVPSFALGMVLPELLDALAGSESQVAPQRRRRGPLGEALADAPDEAPTLGLAEVARRTSNAVRAMERTDRSVLTFDAVRRTFGEEPNAPRRRMPTVEARVELDSEGRVRRVRATRLATGEQVLLEGDEALEAVEAAAPRGRRPAPSVWAEERAAVGQARGPLDQSVVREAPGARLVERAAVPDVRMRSGVGRRLQPLPIDLLGPARFHETDEEAAPGVTTPRRARSPLGESTAAVQRFDGEDHPIDGESTRTVRRPRMVPGLGPITLAAAEGTDTTEAEASPTPRRRRRGPAQPAAARAMARRKGRSTRSLSGTLSRLSEPMSPSDEARPARRLRRRDQPELAWLDAEDDMLDDSVGEAPSWARRAGGSSIGDRKLPDIFSKPRVRTSGGLLTALARAGDPEEVVRVILQRSGDLGDASMLAPEAQRLMHRVVDEAGVVARRSGRSDRAMRGSTTVAPQAQSVVTNMLDPYGPGGFDGSRPHASATSSQGMGASKVMKLANKLMKLIHLAENDGRGDAHKHVRMAENASEVRGETGAGQTSGEQFDEKTMNIKALRQDVLDAVLRALEDLRWRREDPDGPSFWC